MARQMIQGHIVDVGEFPVFAKQCGFTCPAEVTRAAMKNSKALPYMRMEDVIEYFENGGSNGL